MNFILKRVLLILVLSCLIQIAKGQDCILSGCVVDEENNMVPIASVILLQDDSTFVMGATTNEQGTFHLNVGKGGKFILKVHAIGYEQFIKDVDLKQSTDIGSLVLKNTSYTLQEIQITGKTQVVRREADRIVFDTKNVSGAINAADLLNFTPGVIVNGDDVEMFSTQGVKFYSNGKEQKMSSKEMLQVLKSYPAADIDKIELITSPSAKYSAEGKAGIINLKLKKKENNFIGGSASFAHTQYEEKGDDFNANAIYNKGKWSSSVNIGGNCEDNPYKETNTQYFTETNKSVVDNGIIGKKNYFLKGQFDYELNKHWTIGAYALYNNGKRSLDVDSRHELYAIGKETYKITNSVENRKENTKTTTFNINAEQKIGEKGKTIWYNFDYYRLKFDDNSINEALTHETRNPDYIYEDYRYNNMIWQTVDNYSGKIDATLPWGKNTMNVGSLFSHTRNKRRLKYETTQVEGTQEDDFVYDEYIWALYAEYQRSFSDRWSMNAGVRMESTWTKGRSVTTEETDNNSYVRLFPSFFLGYNPNRNHSFNVSIINLVTRPNINNVNPNAIQRDRYDVTVGNPNLRPSYFYKGNIGYTYKGTLSFDLFYSYEPDAMSNIASIDENMVRTTRWENCIDKHSLGLNSFYYFDKCNWFNLTFIQGFYWEKTVSSSSYTLQKEKNINYMAVLNTQFFFDSKRHFTGTLSGNFTSRQKTVTTEIKPLYRMDAGLQYNCLNNKLNIGLTCRNIIASKIRGKEYANGVIMDFSNKFQYLMPRLSITYNWGARLRGKHHEYESDNMKQRVVNDF